MASRTLRAVSPDEKAAPKKPKTLVEAAESNDRLAELEAMRIRIARTISDPNCPPRDLAALSRRQVEIGREVDALKAEQESDDRSNDIAAGDGTFDAAAI